ncbi:MAG TPA: hypothetical protein DEQ84_04910, partial [Prevotellaceae bacterium]|nr:hypothetical protein [Prevotellaceae bacterium]
NPAICNDKIGITTNSAATKTNVRKSSLVYNFEQSDITSLETIADKVKSAFGKAAESLSAEVSDFPLFLLTLQN